VTLGCTGEGNVIFGLRHVQWGRNMVSEAAMLVEVDNQEAVEHIQYDTICDI